MAIASSVEILIELIEYAEGWPHHPGIAVF